MSVLNIISKDRLLNDISTTCCFTGHRRRDLPFSGNVSKQGVKNLISTIQFLCTQSYYEGYRTFITGMAEGTDIICGSIIMNMMNSGEFKDVKLICALPYEEQNKEMFLSEDKHTYNQLLDIADAVVITGNANDRRRYQIRNQFMINHSSSLIAIYKFKTRGSGTSQTINMAKRANLSIHIIDLENNPQFYVE